MRDPRVRLAVLVGGAVGTGLRVLVSALIPLGPDPAAFPVATLVANLSGALLLGLVMGRVPTERQGPAYVGLTTGLLGAYTTFSTLVLEVRGLLADAPVVAIAYATTSVVVGVAVAVAGLVIGRRRQPRAAGAASP